MMLTKDQKVIAARQLCVIRGVNPDGLIGQTPSPDYMGNLSPEWVNRPAWEYTFYEIGKLEQILRAMEFASEFTS